VELDALEARLKVQNESQSAREAELRRREKEAERAGRQQARAYLMDARRRVEEALGSAREAVDEAAAKEARRLVEEGIREEGEQLARVGRMGEGDDGQRGGGGEVEVGSRVRLAAGSAGDVLEIRSDGKLVIAVGAMRMVVEPESVTLLAKPGAADRAAARPASPPPVAAGDPSLEIDLRGMTGDEAEQATVAAVDAAVLAEQPFLRIIHGMGTGVVRERVRRVVAHDRRVARFGFAPRNQGGSGVTIVEFPA
jgi:DNA mismatch repair protein MutS2